MVDELILAVILLLFFGLVFGPILPDAIRAVKWWLKDMWEAITE